MPTKTPPKKRVIDRLLGESPTEKFYRDEVEEVEAALGMIFNKLENREIDLADGSYSVHEALTNIDMMIDAQGWTNVFEYDDRGGLSLRQIKEASAQLRELVVGNPFLQNGARIRSGSVWAGGIDFSARLRTGKQEVKPLPANLQTMIEEVWAQRYFFGNKAHHELERAAYTDGNIFFLGQDATGRMQRVQIHEITGTLKNPNNTEEIWAYRRSWNPKNSTGSASPNLALNTDPYTQQAMDDVNQRVRWYYTDIFPKEERRPRINFGGQPEVAEVAYTMLDFTFNRQVGWALGVPDALCVIAWARLYKEFLVNGYIMSRSLARLAFKVTSSTLKGGQKAAAETTMPGQAGSTAVEGQGNSLSPLSTAGKGYDFGSGNGLASSIAAGLGVSLLALLSNPAAATGSNAAAQTLDPIAKATAAVRRLEWEDDFVRIFRFQGLDRKLVTTWHDLPTDTAARLMQAWTLVDGTELFGAEAMQKGIARDMQIDDPGPVPAGWQAKSKRKPAAVPGTFGKSGSTGGSGQGADDGSGQSPAPHDQDKTAKKK